MASFMLEWKNCASELPGWRTREKPAVRIRNPEAKLKSSTVLAAICRACYIPIKLSRKMQDRITKLCRDLLRADDPATLHPTAQELRFAIAERVEGLRADAQDVALKLLHESEPRRTNSYRVTMEADHVHRPENIPTRESNLA